MRAEEGRARSRRRNGNRALSTRAFDKGHMGVMDYYRMQTVQADTTMRAHIGSNGAEASSPGAAAARP